MKPLTVPGQARALAIVAALLVAAIVVTACGGQTTATIRPSASLLEVEFTQRPTRTPPSSSATGTVAPPTAEPTFLDLPVGWDDAFCQVFGVTVIAQELIIDIERAIEEENVRDARGLSRDLRDTAEEATVLLADVSDWDPAADAKLELTTLIDLYTRAAAEYVTTYAEESRPALRRARALRKQVQQATPAANEAFADLAGMGIECGDLALQLEQF
jgi:hypothetical protein